MPITEKNPRVVSVESLTRVERESANAKLALTGSTGVVVGALVAPVSGRTSPLVLEAGATFVIRVVEKIQTDVIKSLENLYRRLSELNLLGDKTSCGATTSSFWVRRPYSRSTLAEILSSGRGLTEPETAAVVSFLIETIKLLSADNLAHGEICTDNIELSPSPALFDYGLAAALAGIPAAQVVAQKTDVAGAGSVIKELYRRLGKIEQSELIERMISANHAERPSPAQVEAAFFPNKAKAPSLGTNARRSTARVGRVIAQDSIVNSEDLLPGAGGRSTDPDSLLRPNIKNEQVNSAQVKPSSTNFFIIVLVTLAVILSLFTYVRFRESAEPVDGDYAQNWKSNEPALMTVVAQSSIANPNSNAAKIIIESALKGEERSGVKTKLLRVAFSSAWESELTLADRKVALALALSQLVTKIPENMPNLADLHPALVFAVMTSVPIDTNITQLSSIPTTKLATLPAPYGISFGALAKSGVELLADPAAIALAHLLTGDLSQEVLSSYFTPAVDLGADSLKLQIVIPLFGQEKDLEQIVWKVLSAKRSGIGLVVAWFKADSSAPWTKTSDLIKLALVSGAVPATGLSDEQCYDLLQFPLPIVRVQVASGHLAKKFKGQDVDTLSFLASSFNRLSRSQTRQLLSALKTEGEAGMALISEWFKSEPDPLTILNLVLERKEVVGVDYLNIEASRYLRDNSQKWQPSFAQLQAMSRHPEALIRALAYSKLNPKVPKEQQLLQDMSRLEPNLKSRLGIQDKIETK